MKVFLEGVAASGKTSFLKKLLHNNQFKIRCGDFAEFCNSHSLERDEDVVAKQLLYVASFFNDDSDVYDRSPYSSMFYHLIFKHKANLATLKEDDSYKALVEELKKLHWRGCYLIVLLPNFAYSTVLGRMVERKNGYDILTEEYVIWQVEFFNQLTNDVPALFKFPIDEDFTWHEQIRDLIYSLLYNVPLVIKEGNTNLVYDAGIDLTAKNRHYIEKGVMAAVEFNERVFIPPGFVGVIYSRSSFRYGIVSNGVVDATYTGVIKGKIYALEDLDFVPGDRVCQLVIVPLGERPQEVKQIQHIGRGQRSFGSTNTSACIL